MTNLTQKLESSLSFARELNALREQNRVLRQALNRYGRHGSDNEGDICSMLVHSDNPCTCGFAAFDALTNKVPA
jgi:hypothetical protein